MKFYWVGGFKGERKVEKKMKDSLPSAPSGRKFLENLALDGREFLLFTIFGRPSFQV